MVDTNIKGQAKPKPRPSFVEVITLHDIGKPLNLINRLISFLNLSFDRKLHQFHIPHLNPQVFH